MTLSTVDRYDRDRLSAVGDSAVVVGGSTAGLSVARVLADAFEEVVVLERDPLPDDPVARDGAPQTSHPHALLEAGRATLEDLFPGFGEDVLAAGGLLIDSGTDMAHCDQGGPSPIRRRGLPRTLPAGRFSSTSCAARSPTSTTSAFAVTPRSPTISQATTERL